MFLVLRAGNIGIPASQAPLLGLVFNVTFTLFRGRRENSATVFRVRPLRRRATAFSPSSISCLRSRLRARDLADMAFYGLFYALTNPVLKALVVESVGNDVRGRALGIYSLSPA